MDIGLLIGRRPLDQRLSESQDWLGTDFHPIGSQNLSRENQLLGSLEGLEIKLHDPGICVHAYPHPR